MITLHRFNSGPEFILNADLIKYIEKTPDTMITLINNEKLLVAETPDEVVRKTIEHARAIRATSHYLTEKTAENS